MIEKNLNEKGKEELWKAIEEYIDAKIENHISPTISKDKDTLKKVQETEENLKSKIMFLKITLEE